MKLGRVKIVLQAPAVIAEPVVALAAAVVVVIVAENAAVALAAIASNRQI